MANNRMRRIAKELSDIKGDSSSNITVNPAYGDDVTHLKASFPGPPDSPYAGGKFVVDIKIPTEYPFKPPVMKFETKLWHPNVSSQTGAICLDTLGSQWSPVLTIKSALLSLQSLLGSPEPKDPQDAEVANMLMNQPEQFDRVARDWAQKYAGAPKTSGGNYRTSIPPPKKEEKKADYKGYNEQLINRFCEMGFSVDRVVEAFQHAGIDRMGGQFYELEEAYGGDIMAYLFNEP